MVNCYSNGHSKTVEFWKKGRSVQVWSYINPSLAVNVYPHPPAQLVAEKSVTLLALDFFEKTICVIPFGSSWSV